jgi:arylsulfatase
VPYVFNLLMDPMEKMDPESEEWGYVGRKFFASKMWAPTAAQAFVRDHLLSLKQYPPRQGADTLSLHKALEGAMTRLESAHTSNN